MSAIKDEHDRAKAWAKWEQQHPLPIPNAEQAILWLESMRELMFEVWRCNPELRERYEAERLGCPKKR